MTDWKFRGYDNVGDKGWVYGDLTHEKGISKDPKMDLYERVMVSHYEVDPESVGMFSGMKDRNGKEIYEGDILRWKAYLCDDDPCVEWEKPITFTDGVFCADGDCYVSLISIEYESEEFGGMEVVGNIYGNKD